MGVNSETYTLTFATKEDFRDYLYSAMEQSVVDNSSVTIDENDRIVTLSTCTGTDTTRFVVQESWCRRISRGKKAARVFHGEGGFRMIRSRN